MKKNYPLLLTVLSLSVAGFGKTVDITEFSQLEEYSVAPEDGTILRVTADFTVEEYLPFQLLDELTFDLNGHTVRFDGNFGITGYGVFKVIDSDPDKKGTMVVGYKNMLLVGGNASLIIEGGNFSSDSDYPMAMITNLDYSSVVINGGSFRNPHYSSVIENKGDLEINGGTFQAPTRCSYALVNTVGEGVTTINGGAFYAGNETASRCFEALPFVTDEYEEIPVLNLPSGVIDGGAVVLNEEWAIPGSYFINYVTQEAVPMQPGMHWYYPGNSFTLPECDRREGVPFAGWSESPEGSGELLTEVTAETARNLQLYPVWKYVALADGVTPDLTPVSTTPEDGSVLEELSSIVIYFSDGEDMDLYVNHELGENACVERLIWGTPEFYCNVSLDTYWDGSLRVAFDEALTEPGTYRVFIPAGTVGDDDYEYGWYEEGRCNPDLFIEYVIENGNVSDRGMTTDPEDGAIVSTLTQIRFLFEDDTVMYDYDKEALLTDEAGNTVMTLTAMDCNYDEDTILMILPEEISTAGIYTLSIPAGFFGYDWGTDPIGEAVFTWTVDPTSVGVYGIEAVKVKTTEYFNLSGSHVTVPAKGIKIVRETLDDGSVRIRKSMN